MLDPLLDKTIQRQKTIENIKDKNNRKHKKTKNKPIFFVSENDINK